jgi:hypothetical protein
VRRWVAVLIVSVCVAAAAAGAASAIAATWKPDVHAAHSYVKARLHHTAAISWAVRTPHGYWGQNGGRLYPSASAVKAMLLVAYLNLGSVKNRDLKSSDHNILDPMIQRSDDHAADKVFHKVGFGGLRKLAKKVGMKRFKTGCCAPRSWGCASTKHWGCSSIDADDQTKFFINFESFIIGQKAPAHRVAALRLLNEIVTSQRWGFWQAKPSGWHLYCKAGWGLGTGWVDHQVSLLLQDSALGGRVALTVLTYHDQNHSYGKETLKGLAKRLLRGLNSQTVVR